MQKTIFIALAGLVGTLLRYWLSGFVARQYGVTFPWGTMAVNLIGCLATGGVLSNAGKIPVESHSSDGDPDRIARRVYDILRLRFADLHAVAGRRSWTGDFECGNVRYSSSQALRA